MSETTAEQAPARTRLLSDAPLRERRIVAGGTDTAVLEGGVGRPMVLLHGPGEFAGVWLPVLDDLTASHHVVVPDLPGHGASALPAAALTVDLVLAWVEDVIAQTCAEPPVLVGRVVGGAIAARYTAAHPSGVDQLVMVDTTGLVPFSPEPRFGLALQRFLADPSAATYERFMDLCAFDLDTARRQLGSHWAPYAEYAVELARDAGVQAAIGSFLALFAARPLPTETWEAIGVPTTMIWGRQDAAIPLAVAEGAAARHGWPLHVIEAAGDDPPLDRPTEFVEVLLRALEAGVRAS